MSQGSPDRVDDPRERALARAYRFLGRRERTAAELRQHLEAHEIAPDLIEATIAELRDQGYLDDARYARLFAEDKRRLEHWGTERIERALRQRGLDRDLIAQATAGHDHADEIEQAVSLLRRRGAGSPDDPRERERALGVLLRKGYDSDLALDALNIYKRSISDHDLG